MFLLVLLSSWSTLPTPAWQTIQSIQLCPSTPTLLCGFPGWTWHLASLCSLSAWRLCSFWTGHMASWFLATCPSSWWPREAPEGLRHCPSFLWVPSCRHRAWQTAGMGLMCMVGHCACPHRHKRNSPNFFLANFLLPAVFWTSDQVYVFLLWLKKQTKQKPGMKFRQLETWPPQGRERLAHSARNSECWKVKCCYRKNSNFPCAISLWWLVYNKQNRLNLLICQC